ncbi:DUF7133 domain-containing protein [Gayadomonas joobiniege]|uniref:DUF7133 domain-containing protein n=1 Tax=Gayadomonas joobiniege TaxID=1234606 RepID=UPI00037977F7|nr:hypothetical protein [Gayadomonas joobiniege]
MSIKSIFKPSLFASLLPLGLLLTSTHSFANKNYIPEGYELKTVMTPKDVPFHITGLDSAENGDIYVVTRLGEVWRYDQKWHKFADGLHEPTGLMVDDDGSILVAQKPELTRLVDTNKDGWADEYIQIVDDWDFHDNYHEFTFGPVKDKAGNLYGTLNLSHGAPNSFSLGTMGSAGGWRGWAFEVTKAGEFKPFAYGLRSPAGIGISPEDELFFTDNQGDWVPTSKMHLLQKDKFYAHPVSLIDHPDWDEQKIRNAKPEDFAKFSEKPVVWIPHIEVANSPGNPEWDTSGGKFGPFEGQIFIGDQTQSNVFRVILDKVKGEYQGAVINFVGGMQSGNIRTHIDNKGQLWVGQTARGWGAKGGKPFGLQKIVWNGKQPFEVLDVKLVEDGFKLTFTQALKASSVKPSSFAAKHWHYDYNGNYGSPKRGVTQLPIKTAKLSDDGKTVHLKMSLTADKVVQIDFNGVKNKAGSQASTRTLYYTLNQLNN